MLRPGAGLAVIVNRAILHAEWKGGQ